VRLSRTRVTISDLPGKPEAFRKYLEYKKKPVLTWTLLKMTVFFSVSFLINSDGYFNHDIIRLVL
jgi:hypothetical protein